MSLGLAMRPCGAGCRTRPGSVSRAGRTSARWIALVSVSSPWMACCCSRTTRARSVLREMVTVSPRWWWKSSLLSKAGMCARV